MAAAKARASKHNRAKIRCDDVKVEPAESRRRIADRMGAMAAMDCNVLSTKTRQYF